MEPLEQFDVVVPVFQKLAAATSPAQLDDRTPCSEWAMRDLFDHLITGGTTFAALVRGDEPPVPAKPTDDAMAAAASAAVADVDAAFRQPGAMERIVPTPFGDLPGEVFARLLAFDLLMHTWDLARTTDQDVPVPDEVVLDVDAFARQALTADLRGPGTFGPEVEAPAGASPIDRLAAFSGRTP